MTRKVLGKAEITEGQRVRTLNIILLLLVIGSTIMGIHFTIGKDLVLLPIVLGVPAAIIVMINIGFLYKK